MQNKVENAKLIKNVECGGSDLISDEGVGFEIKLLDICSDGSQTWQNYELILYVNCKARRFFNQPVIASPQGEAIQLVELTDQTAGRFRFNLSERNEISALQKQLESFINNPAKQELFFEPADPSFELNIKRIRHSNSVNNILNLSQNCLEQGLRVRGSGVDSSVNEHAEDERNAVIGNSEASPSEEEFKVYLWVDAGNSTRLMYSWDAEGIRFLVTKTQLSKFTNQL